MSLTYKTFISLIILTIAIGSIDSPYILGRIIRNNNRNYNWLDIHTTFSNDKLGELRKIFKLLNLPLPVWMVRAVHGTVVAIDKRVGKVIGGFQYEYEPIEFSSEVKLDLTFAVHPDYQGKGIGEFLFFKLVDIIEKAGYRSFTFAVIRPQSLGFWLEMEAKIIEERESPSGEPIYEMKYIIPKD